MRLSYPDSNVSTSKPIRSSSASANSTPPTNKSASGVSSPSFARHPSSFFLPLPLPPPPAPNSVSASTSPPPARATSRHLHRRIQKRRSLASLPLDRPHRRLTLPRHRPVLFSSKSSLPAIATSPGPQLSPPMPTLKTKAPSAPPCSWTTARSSAHTRILNAFSGFSVHRSVDFEAHEYRD
jgi:hypothetical protein